MDIQKFLIKYNATIKEALEKLNETAKKVLFVVNDNSQLVGSLSDGDIRRWILKTGSLSGNINSVYNKSPIYFHTDYNIEEAKEKMIERRIGCIPIVNDEKEVTDILFWDTIFEEKYFKIKPKLNIPVVIMAGGKGTRLDPFTRILPKPLIPIGNKAVLEVILDKFSEYSIKDFYLIVNYKCEMIKSYFDNIQHNYNLHYVQEQKPLGTSGGLKLLSNDVGENFFVSNCDIIINEDYAKIYKFHQDNKNDITIVAAMQNFKIPYGIIEIKNGGGLKSIKEKPEYNFLVNIGMYILNKKVLREIPDNQPYDMTDLISKLELLNKYKVGVYPVNQASWYDIGQWGKYKESIRIMEENNDV